MAVFAGYPLEVQPGGHKRFDLVVQQRADYIAKTAGTRDFPWRIIKIAASDLDLLDTDFSFLEAGRYRAVIFQTGINTDRIGNDYKKLMDEIARKGKKRMHLAPGGGFAMKHTRA